MTTIDNMGEPMDKREVFEPEKVATYTHSVFGGYAPFVALEDYQRLLAANREKDAEIARLTTQCEVDNIFAKFCQKKAADSQTLLREAESQLASLRASGGEKERADRAEALLQVASEEHDRTRILRGWPVLNNIDRWEIELDMKKYRESFNVAPPTLTREKE